MKPKVKKKTWQKGNNTHTHTHTWLEGERARARERGRERGTDEALFHPSRCDGGTPLEHLLNPEIPYTARLSRTGGTPSDLAAMFT